MIQKTSISTYDFEHFSRLNQIRNKKNNYLISGENNFSLKNQKKGICLKKIVQVPHILKPDHSPTHFLT